jgi:O-antigen/teichoic acid export membrane protein
VTGALEDPAVPGPQQALSTHTAAPLTHDDAPTGLFQAAPLSKAMATYLPATGAIRLINFARVLLLTWWMTQQQFGLLSMILLTINVMTPLCSLGLNEAVARYVPQHEARGSLRPFAWQAAGLLLAVTAASMALLFVFAWRLGVFFYAQVFSDPVLFSEFSTDAAELARLSAVVIGLLIAYFYLLAVLKGLRMFTALAVVELVHSLLFLAGSVLAMATGHLSAFTLTAVYGISMAIPIAGFGWSLGRALGNWRSQHAPVQDQSLAKTLLKFSVWTTLAGVTWQILANTLIQAWFLNKHYGNEAVGIFNAMRQIGQFVLLGAIAVSTVVMTTVTNTWESRGREAAQRQLSLAFRGTGFALLLLCGFCALVKDLIIKMYRLDYAPGAAILPLHLLFFLIASYLAFLPIHFHLREKTRHMFWPWAIGVGANFLWAVWLASPRLTTLQQWAPWSFVSSITSFIFATGFSGPQGLGGATWCGILAIVPALVLCILLIRAECTRLDRGTYIVMAWALLLAARPWIIAVGLAVLLILALKTKWIFSPEERRRIAGYVVGSLSHIPPLRMLRARRHGGA